MLVYQPITLLILIKKLFDFYHWICRHTRRPGENRKRRLLCYKNHEPTLSVNRLQ